MKIRFCGAAKKVTGSCPACWSLDDGYKVLLDCGMFQGENNEDLNRQWFFKPGEIDAVSPLSCSYRSLRQITQTCQRWLRWNIYCTPATRDLAAIMLMDSAKIQENDAGEYDIKRNSKHDKNRREAMPPLYTIKDAGRVMGQFVNFNYDRWFRIHDHVEVLFRDAGHILGGANVTLRIRQGKRHPMLWALPLTSGRPDRPILPKTLSPCFPWTSWSLNLLTATGYMILPLMRDDRFLSNH